LFCWFCSKVGDASLLIIEVNDLSDQEEEKNPKGFFDPSPGSNDVAGDPPDLLSILSCVIGAPLTAKNAGAFFSSTGFCRTSWTYNSRTWQAICVDE